MIDRRIKFLRLAHQGVSSARNAGLQAACGEVIFYLDSDNSWNGDFLRYMVAFILASGVRAAYCGLKALGDGGTIRFYRGESFNFLECLSANYIDMNCFAHRRLDYSKFQFDPKLRRLVDWDYILRVTRTCGATFVPYLGVNYYHGSRKHTYYTN